MIYLFHDLSCCTSKQNTHTTLKFHRPANNTMEGNDGAEREDLRVMTTTRGGAGWYT